MQAGPGSAAGSFLAIQLAPCSGAAAQLFAPAVPSGIASTWLSHLDGNCLDANSGSQNPNERLETYRACPWRGRVRSVAASSAFQGKLLTELPLPPPVSQSAAATPTSSTRTTLPRARSAMHPGATASGRARLCRWGRGVRVGAMDDYYNGFVVSTDRRGPAAPAEQRVHCTHHFDPTRARAQRAETLRAASAR